MVGVVGRGGWEGGRGGVGKGGRESAGLSARGGGEGRDKKRKSKTVAQGKERAKAEVRGDTLIRVS
jgi:hypothetical protein